MGGDDRNQRLKSTEMIDQRGQVDGPDLPEALFYHAAIKVNDSTTMVIGGWNTTTPYSSNTYLYVKGEAKWQPGPQLNVGRWGHSVGKCVDKSSHLQYIIATGGVTAESTKSTEILYPGSQQWIKGP